MKENKPTKRKLFQDDDLNPSPSKKQKIMPPSFFSKLNDTCLTHIFSFIHAPEILAYSCVCKRWRDMIGSEDFWNIVTSLDFSPYAMNVNYSQLSTIICKCSKIEELNLRGVELSSSQLESILQVVGDSLLLLNISENKKMHSITVFCFFF